MLVVFAACEKPDPNTDPQKEDQEQGQEQQSESDIAKQALAVLKQAGIEVASADIKFQGVIRTAKRDGTSEKYIGYYQICCVKSQQPIIYVLSYEASHGLLFEGRNYQETEIAKTNLKYIKTYKFDIPEPTISVDQGYGRVIDNIPFSEAFFSDFIKCNNIYYGYLRDMYGEGTENATITNHRLLIDSNGYVNTVKHTIENGEDMPSGYKAYNGTMYPADGDNVILGFYCYAPSGEVLYKVSAWSDLYTHSDDGNYGSWAFPLSQGKFLFVDFNGSNNTKADPCDGYVRFIMDDLISGDCDYVKSKSLGKNIFEQAKFKSASSGVYDFTMNATLYSGEKHSFAISVDTNKKTLTIDGETVSAPLFARDSLIGTWHVEKAKFTEQAEMTKWEHESTSIEFKKNGEFEGKGYFGNGSGTYTVEENYNTIHTFINNQPFITYEVTAYDKENNVAQMTATVESSSQKIWLECAKYIVNTPIVVIGDDTFFQTENDCQMMVNAAYSEVRKFELCQMYAEHQILNKDRTLLQPTSSLVEDIWNYGYKAIRNINYVINGVSANSCPFNDNVKIYFLGQCYALRAFVNYNLCVLFGDVPYVSEDLSNDDMMNGLAKTSWQTILTKEIAALEPYISSAQYKSFSPTYFTSYSIRLLLAEMSLFLGNQTSQAKSYAALGNSLPGEVLYEIPACVDYTMDTFPVVKYCREMFGEEVLAAPIYYNYYVQLYCNEADQNIDGLISSWNYNGKILYGYWSMLKRLGKAKETVECEDYQLLLPIPREEVDRNPKMTQNPGY